MHKVNNMQKVSLKTNALLNAFRTLVNILFPLITFKYASEVLMADNLGKVNFSSSIISYFVLIADFGIGTYASREGAKYRSDKDSFQRFASNIFTINVYATLVSYVLLLILVANSNKIEAYKWVLGVQSITIMFTVVGATWINTIFEDFKSILFRSIFVQIFSLALLFILVRAKEDYLLYASVSVIAQSGASLLNFFYIRKKYIKLSVHHSNSIFKYIKPLWIVFCTSIATTIYAHSDITMIGIYLTDKDVALYSVAVKIYTVLKALFAALLIVEIPRLTEIYYKREYSTYRHLTIKTFNVLFTLLVPLIVLIIILGKESILFISSDEFLSAETSLLLLSIAIIVSLYATFVTTALILPQGLEKGSFYASIISSLLNIGLNAFFIPIMGIDGAALTTILSEFSVCCILTIFIIKKNKTNLSILADRSTLKNFYKILLGLAVMVFMGLFLSSTVVGFWNRCIFISFISTCVYVVTLLILKHEVMIKLIQSLIIKIKKYRNV